MQPVDVGGADRRGVHDGWEARHLVAFFGITFAITWGLAAVVVVGGEGLERWFGPLDTRRPFWKAIVHLATYGPAIAALGLVAYTRGRDGLAVFLRRCVRWRVAWPWYVVVLLLYPGIRLGARALANALGWQDVPLMAIDPWYAIVPVFVVALFDDPGAMEELGWRAFALPLLQRRMGAVAASVVLGLIWGLWHLPAFAISAMAQSGFSLQVFLAGSVVLSLLMTFVYNCTGGNVLLMFLMHGIGNFHYGVATTPGPGEMGLATAIGGMIALVLVVNFGPTNLGVRRETEVLGSDDRR